MKSDGKGFFRGDYFQNLSTSDIAPWIKAAGGGRGDYGHGKGGKGRGNVFCRHGAEAPKPTKKAGKPKGFPAFSLAVFGRGERI